MKQASLLLTFALIAPVTVDAAPLLSTSTEHAPDRLAAAPVAVVRQLLLRINRDSAELFAECAKERRMGPLHVAAEFRAVKLASPVPGRELYFIRPAMKPRCRAFYGAHLFQYWLVEHDTAKGPGSLALLFEGAGDHVEVLSQTTSGRYHLEGTSCTASECSVVEWMFADNAYRPTRCKTLVHRNDGTPQETRTACAR